jgi:hypothetical protein
MSSLRDILKELSLKFLYVEIHRELLDIMKEEYVTLKKFFADDTDPKKRRTRQKAPVTGPDAVADVVVVANEALEVKVENADAEETIPLPPNTKLLANTKIRIIKKSAEPLPKEEVAVAVAVVEAVVPEAETRMNSKDLKAWQKEKEALKLQELISKGINPDTLLTVANIKQWIEEEKRTFAYVAREYVGLPEAKVADFAREHGVKSTISKKRAILSAKNRAP